MARGKTTTDGKTYHREDLRGDLLRAARAYVAEHGHATLSVRTLAQQVGVSPGAPYHHFPDRRALLLALAAAGFEDLLSRTDRLVATAGSSEAGLVQLALGFFAFAEANPRLLDLMYESELTSPGLDPGLLRYQVLGHDALTALVAAGRTDLPPAEIELRGMMLWSAIYGFTTMRRKGVLRSYGTAGFAADGTLDGFARRLVHATLAD